MGERHTKGSESQEGGRKALPLSDARVFSRGWLRWPLKMVLLAGRPLACEQALCLEKKIALDQRPVHRLAGR